MTAIPIGIGVIAWVVVHRAGRGVPMRARLNVFEHLFERLEPSGLALLAAVAALLLLLARPAGRRVAKDDAPREGDVRSWERRRFAFFVAAVVLALSWLGREWVFFGVDLAMDEFASWFQARIFLEGCLRAPVPPSWARYVPALIPTFISFDPASAAWASSYLPVFALLRTAALAVGAEGALNPLLTAVAMPLIWTLCRRLWPGERDCAAVGTVLLGTSSQVLVNAMTGYAMPAHLTANLAWILLWLSPGRVPALALPLVGGLALGLHNPFPHALFVAPFLLASTRKWSVRRLVYTGVVYAAFTAGWWAWLRAFHPQATSSGGPLAIFSAPGWGQVLLQAMNLALVFSWQSPVALVLVAGVVASGTKLEGPVRLAVLGFALSFGFYLLFPASQGHGWGYRYVHGALGGWVLLSVAGYRSVRDVLGRAAAGRVVRAGTVATLVVLLPIRLLQVRDFASPFSAGFRLVSSIRAEAVVVDVAAGWYAWDLVRNDPFLRNRPVVLSLVRLSAADWSELVRKTHGSVRLVGEPALAGAGLTTYPGSGPRGRRASPAD